MANDMQAPATKQDIAILMEQIGTYYDRTERRFIELDEKIERKAEETKRYFDVVAEDMRHDYLGAHKDRIENHEDRIRRLEKKTGVAA